MNNYSDLAQQAWEWSKLMKENYYLNHCGAFYQPKRSTKIKNKRRNRK